FAFALAQGLNIIHINWTHLFSECTIDAVCGKLELKTNILSPCQWGNGPRIPRHADLLTSLHTIDPPYTPPRGPARTPMDYTMDDYGGYTRAKGDTIPTYIITPFDVDAPKEGIEGYTLSLHLR
ncbi:UNVERIFIED_CONTAM: hypothetical protein Sindi_2494600, partial [Sesamum indicum]